MKILITGANGFIGNHLAQSFSYDSYIYRDCNARHEVVCSERMYSSDRSRPNLPHFFVDLTDKNDVDTLVSGVKPDVIFHCAAHASVIDSVTDPEKDAQANIIGTINLITSAKSNDVSKIIYSSSGGASYGEQQTEEPMTEEHPVNPLSPYGFSKWAAEQYFKILDFPNYCVLRYSNVYGKSCRGVVKYFKECYDFDVSPVVHGTGNDTTRDYIHVNDVVGANRLALRNDLDGIYNVSSGVATTLNQLWETLIQANASDPLTSHTPQPIIYTSLRDGECIHNVLSSEKLQTEGWKPEVDLITGLVLDI